MKYVYHFILFKVICILEYCGTGVPFILVNSALHEIMSMALQVIHHNNCKCVDCFNLKCILINLQIV